MVRLNLCYISLTVKVADSVLIVLQFHENMASTAEVFVIYKQLSTTGFLLRL